MVACWVCDTRKVGEITLKIEHLFLRASRWRLVASHVWHRTIKRGCATSRCGLCTWGTRWTGCLSRSSAGADMRCTAGVPPQNGREGTAVPPTTRTHNTTSVSTTAQRAHAQRKTHQVHVCIKPAVHLAAALVAPQADHRRRRAAATCCTRRSKWSSRRGSRRCRCRGRGRCRRHRSWHRRPSTSTGTTAGTTTTSTATTSTGREVGRVGSGRVRHANGRRSQPPFERPHVGRQLINLSHRCR